MAVLVTGATGFIGRRVAQELLDRHYDVRCLIHTPGRERVFPPLSVDPHYGDVRDTDALAAACYNLEAVVHLAAITRQSRRTGATFEAINYQGTAKVVAAAKEAGAAHFVHVSMVGADDNSASRFLYSKWQSEQAVIESQLPYTIIRSTLAFGEGDHLITSIAGLARVLPVVPVIGTGRNRLQPIAVEDLARCITLTIGRDDLKGRIIMIGGPQQSSYNEIISAVTRAMGKRRLRLHLPPLMARFTNAALGALLAHPPIDPAYLELLAVRNVAETDTVEEVFGFTPRPLAGNIEFIKSVRWVDGLNLLLGNRPANT